MKRIEPETISAYLDGELDPASVREIERAIADDPELHAEVAALQTLDGEWRAAARSAAFHTTVNLPSGSRAWVMPARTGALIALLIAIRVLPKLADTMTWPIMLHAVALIAALVWLARTVNHRGGLTEQRSN